MKKIASLLIALIMAATAFTACNGNNDDTSSAADNSANLSQSTDTSDESKEESRDPYKNEKGIYDTTFDKTLYKGRTCTVIVRGSAGGSGSIYASDDFTTDSEWYGDTLNLAVQKRNELVEEMYGVELEVIKDQNINNSIKIDMDSGNATYDIIMPTLSTLATYAKQGNLYDLTELENIHLDAPWYSQHGNETFSMGEHLFYTTGDITILNKVCVSSILFNRQYADQLKMPNFYDLVRDHEWTFDKLIELSRLATYESDGETGMTGADNWGMLTAYGDAMTFYHCFGYSICEKDSEDYPVYTITNEDSLLALQNIITALTEKGTWCCYAQDFSGDIWVTSLEAFQQGRVLFRPSAFSAATKLRISGTDFGILPQPLKDENQEEYLSAGGYGETAGFGIPLSCDDPEFSAYMVEVYSCEAKNYITPAYMEVNLKGKDAGSNDDDLEMLEIIFNNIRYDVGAAYSFANISTEVYNMVQKADTNVVSKFESLSGTMQSDLETVVEEFQERF